MEIRDLEKLAEIYRSIKEEKDALEEIKDRTENGSYVSTLEASIGGMICALKLLRIKIAIEVREE